MPLSYEQLINNTVPVTFKYEGEDITVHYCPGKITDSVYAKIMNFARSGTETTEDTLKAVNEMLVSLLQKWDIYEDIKQTKMYPLDPVRLANLPVSLKLTALIEVANHVRPEGDKP